MNPTALHLGSHFQHSGQERTSPSPFLQRCQGCYGSQAKVATRLPAPTGWQPKVHGERDGFGEVGLLGGWRWCLGLLACLLCSPLSSAIRPGEVFRPPHEYILTGRWPHSPRRRGCCCFACWPAACQPPSPGTSP